MALRRTDDGHASPLEPSLPAVARTRIPRALPPAAGMIRRRRSTHAMRPASSQSPAAARGTRDPPTPVRSLDPARRLVTSSPDGDDDA